ncbi:MAG: cobamide remodeling phosphodiesterase CbiR [Chloroflexota bacterium]
MRFGIMAMQIDALIPPAAQGLPPQDMLASVLSFSHAGLVRGLFAAGFNPIELGGDLGMLLPTAFSPPAIDELAALKDELGMRYTVHLPLWSVEPSTLLEPVRQGSVQAIVDVISATRPLKPEVYVLHATGALAAEFYRMRLPEAVRALLLGQFQARARQSIQAILQQTGLPSRQLAIETIEFPFDLTLELAEALDLSICLDTGHVLVGFSGPVELFEALERCLPRLAEVHLHDGPWQGPEMHIGYGKDHQPLGRGDLDVARFLARLQEAGFGGPIIFELSLPQAQDSLNTIHQISESLS